uniref:Uncharacterized protein n=1 Tax=Lactuca sativa TaxID=4236 RepID=A0A9R1VJF2_LACSA|nr:hypothetical protein LSAT_V11C500263830 [Lactuca sativa]
MVHRRSNHRNFGNHRRKRLLDDTIILFLTKGTLPTDDGESRKVRINAARNTMYEDRLCRKGYSTPWLKCIVNREEGLVIVEIHAGICEARSRSRSIT